MKRFVFRISIVLVLVILLPIIFFISRQLSNLTENEELVQDAYEKQLESVLFTVNLNAENILYAWVNRIDLPISFTNPLFNEMINTLISDNIALKQISFFETSNMQEIVSYCENDTSVQTIPYPKREILDKLVEYSAIKYQRLDADRVSDYTEIFFIPKYAGAKVLCAFIVHTKTFVDLNLGPAMQKVGNDKFAISVIDDISKGVIYPSISSKVAKSKVLSDKLWYLPGYSINISLLSATIDDLVKERSRRDQYFLWAVLFFVLIGSCFLILNIRKEIKLAEMKSEFVSNVSHEIRTPLALISMYAETLMLKRVKTAEKADEYLRIINLETNRLSVMVNRILSFSKMEKNKRKFHFTSFKFNDLVTEVVDSFKPYFAEQHVIVALKLHEGTDNIIADRDAIAEAIINVVENAVKYGRADGKRVEIITYRNKEYQIVEINDNGIGIASKHQKYIFDQFYRVTQGNLANCVKGTGLGLNIVRQIVKAHKGSVTLKSKLGEGSSFQLKFSLKKC